MELTDFQKDALTELINIAFSRTAASLSELTGNRVDLDVPEVATHPISHLSPALERFVSGDVATVHQIFAGPLAGDALLLLNYDGAVNLVKVLTGGAGDGVKRFGVSAKEVLTEIGNILLNACLGIFGDLLQIRFSFTVPRLHLDALGTLLNSLVIGKDDLHHALVVGAKFRLRQSEINGCLVIILALPSLDLLVRAVENWGMKSITPANPTKDF